MALQKPEQLELLSKKKRSKYGNRKIALGGHTFDSIAEAARWIQLCDLEKKGEIFRLRVKADQYEFQCGVKYTPDFIYWVKRNPKSCYLDMVIEDVKGFRTKDFKIKQKLLLCEYEKEIKIVRMDSKTARTLVDAYLGQHKNKK